MKKFFEFVTTNWDIIAPCVYEIIVRVIPTKKNLSLIDNGWKVLNFVITNRRKPSANDDIIAAYRDQENKIIVKRNRHILRCIIFLLMTLPSLAVAQNPNNQFKATYFNTPQADTTFVKNTRNTLANLNGPTGGIMFDETLNKWRVWNPALNIWSDWNLFNSSGITGFWPLGGTGIFTDNVNIVGGSFSFSGGFADFNITGSGGGISTSGGNMQFTGIGAITTDVATIYRLQRNGSDRMTIDASGIVTFFPTATQPSFNLGSFAGNPTSLFNGNIWHNSSAGSIGARVNGNNQYITTIPQTLAANDGRIYYSGSAGGQLQGNSSITITSANRINSPNATFSTNLTLSYIPTTQIPYATTSGSITSESALTYDATTNILFSGGLSQTTVVGATSFVIGSQSTNNIQIAPGGDLLMISNGSGLIRTLSPPTIEVALATGNTNTEILTLDPITDRIEIRDASSLVPTLTATQIGFGSGSNLLTSDPTFNWDNSTKVITIGTLAGVHSQWQDEALEFNNGGTFIGGLDYSGSVFRVAGTSQMNLEVTNGGLHLRYDGSGTNADLVITDITGSMRSNCTGAPSGAVYNNGDGILRICP